MDSKLFTKFETMKLNGERGLRVYDFFDKPSKSVAISQDFNDIVLPEINTQTSVTDTLWSYFSPLKPIITKKLIEALPKQGEPVHHTHVFDLDILATCLVCMLKNNSKYLLSDGNENLFHFEINSRPILIIVRRNILRKNWFLDAIYCESDFMYTQANRIFLFAHAAGVNSWYKT